MKGGIGVVVCGGVVVKLLVMSVGRIVVPVGLTVLVVLSVVVRTVEVETVVETTIPLVGSVE